MKKLLLTTMASLALATSSTAEEIKLGVIFGFTGPIESLTGPMASGAEMAMAEVSESGLLLDGATVSSVRGDSTCIDSAAATAAAERLITADQVNAIVGADCSGVTGAILQNVARANGVVMISPSATSPGLSHANNEDNGLFFRTAPSDARQGVVMTDVLIDQGIKEVALTYTNNDYGKGLADSFAAAFEAAGGTVTINAAHEDGKGDYSAEVAALAAAGGERLVVAGYVDQGGRGVIQAALDTGAFDTFALGDGMFGESLLEAIGSDLDGSTVGTVPGSEGQGAGMFLEAMGSAGKDGDGPYRAESYDAAALITLAMQAGGDATKEAVAANVLAVANAPGEKIYPGELAKALQILKDGGDIDYVGATAVELIGPGESAGNYRQIVIEGGEITTAKYR